jgi:hypothetical protein
MPAAPRRQIKIVSRRAIYAFEGICQLLWPGDRVLRLRRKAVTNFAIKGS